MEKYVRLVNKSIIRRKLGLLTSKQAEIGMSASNIFIKHRRSIVDYKIKS